jgi:ATP-binding cassette subfamily F protein 3
LESKGGEMKWGHGCEIGTYAQHVYTTLPEDDTVLEYLEYMAEKGTTNQQILAVAGSLLFRNDHVKKKIKVLSGGERARLCMAGLLLGSYNILVLDEPGNHLDVETVESLATALEKYRGTVIFTSHDRHFMKRVATSVIEVRDGKVKNYLGDYEAYVASINEEIEDGRRGDQATGKTKKSPKAKAGKSADTPRAKVKLNRKAQKEISNLENKIKKLSEEKASLNEQLLSCTDPAFALELHDEFTKLTKRLDEAETRWIELN